MSGHSGKIVFDLDGVIAGPKTDSYDDCVPNRRMIARMRELKALGYTIAIHTSRNVRSHEHNQGKLIADTAITIKEWLIKHDVPHDELWMGKPWVGKTGVYVDDRAVTPAQFLSLEMGELMNIVRKNSFGSKEMSKQDWIVHHVGPGEYLQGFPVKLAQLAKDMGYRLALISDMDLPIPYAVRYELSGFGVKVFPDASYTYLASVSDAARNLILDGEMTIEANVVVVPQGMRLTGIEYSEAVGLYEEVELKNEEVDDVVVVAGGELSVLNFGDEVKFYKIIASTESNEIADQSFDINARHFNHVRVEGNKVYKTAHGIAAQKLAFEVDWLQNVQGGVSGVELIADGYMSDRYDCGSMADVITRTSSTDFNVIEGFAVLIAQLWNSVKTEQPDPVTDLVAEHDQFIMAKSLARLEQMKYLFAEHRMPSYDKHWVINDEKMPLIAHVVAEILNAIPVQEVKHRGAWHGDFCPGNIVMDSDREEMALIDPRGTLDGKTAVYHGDRRYDLGKLAHALRYGYDSILAGHYTCEWTEYQDESSIDLDLWDEHDVAERSMRSRIWSELVKQNKIRAGDVELNDDVVHLLAALQLITCAPLHIDDPQRATALVARGLQAGVQTLERIKRK